MRAAAWSAALCCFATATLFPSAPFPSTVSTHTALAQTRCTTTAASSPAILARPTVAERALRFRDAWALADGAGVTIAIIDTGVADHPRLGGVLDGGDVTGGAGAFHDCDAHGTFVAGLAAGRPGNDTVAGVAPGATLLSIRHTTGEEGTLGSLATAIDAAVERGARVINVSLTSCAPPGVVPPGAPEVTAAVLRAEESGAVIVAAAGNTGGDCPEGAVAWPAILDEVIAVTAAESVAVEAAPADAAPAEAVPAGYAVAADWVDVAAPGGPVVGPAPDGETMADLQITGSRTAPIVGTSFAAPLVSGTAALLLSRHPELSPVQVRGIITATSSPVSSAPGIGVGMVDPVAAVTWAGGPDGGTDAAAAPPPPAEPVDPAPGLRVRALALVVAAVVTAAILWSAGTAHTAANAAARVSSGPSRRDDSTRHGTGTAEG
ncbi:S8 family serine peptidase [Corynebacterium sp. NPDC060344]|uniref:S8 family serine peptidase n=1 Tax=Corynebacterium sp. NPDC060344 TaxID=3347101 RepID=UPI003648DFB2